MKNDDRPRHYRKDTLLTHVGRNPEANFGIVNPPVYHASTILSKNMAEWEAKRAAPPLTGVRYGLHGTPGTFPLEELLAKIEGGYRGMLMSSGLAAVTAPLQALLGAGDHCLMVDSAYGPARNFCEGILKKCGVETTYYDPLIGEGIAPDDIASKGFGKDSPVASNDTAAGRQQNRRVEMVVSGDIIGTPIGASPKQSQ